MSTNPKTLERAITALERQNLVMAVVVSLVLLSAGFVAYGADDTTNLRTSHLQLIDQSGMVRAELSLRDNAPGFRIFDENGRERILLIHDTDQTALFINDESETTRVGVAQFAHGGSGFALHGAESKGAVVLYLKKRGSLRFINVDGEVIHQYPQTND